MSKFKNTEELEKAYQELERKFTKKSQKLALYEKTNYVTLLNNEIDSLVDDYAKRKISNLEAKLAESEKSKESYRLQNEQHHLQLLQFYSRLGVEAFGADIHEKALETLMIMKEQIAEKDAEIKQLKLDLGMFRSVNEFLNGYGIEKAREVLLQTEKTKQQDKISFAVEQIIKTKETLIKFLQDEGFYENEWYDLFDKIDNQINELKEGK